MSNSYFQFKQFTIRQDKCAMKVCTDACLFGAWAASLQSLAANCLDIGAGTGLLALMLAQKNSTATIDAVELNKDAAEQAAENITASPWANRVKIFNADIIEFDMGKKYEFILSNPPFFEDDLQSPHEAVNDARHNSSLTLVQLLEAADRLLLPDGHLAVLLPITRVDYFINQALTKGFYLQQQTLVKQSPGHNVFRGMLFFSKQEAQPLQKEMSIKNTENRYTAGFTALLQDYYLYL